MGPIELLEKILKEIEELEFDDRKKLDYIERRLTMVVIKLFGQSSHHHNGLLRIDLIPSSYRIGDTKHLREVWSEGHGELENYVRALIEELKLFGVPGSKVVSDGKVVEIDPHEIFIVHGHDEAMKSEVARTLEKVGLNPIILHEQPDQGRTIIEKFTDHSNVGFAVVLLSPDDIGYSVKAGPEDQKYRARQNVILELGFFLGKLGRRKVVVLHKGSDLELPSDYQGVLYTPYDNGGAWQYKLAKELRACGYEVDTNDL